MKRTLAILLTLTMLVSLVACGGNSNTSQSGAPPSGSAPSADSAPSAEPPAEVTDWDDLIDKDITIGIALFNYSNNWCAYQKNAMINYIDTWNGSHENQIDYIMTDAAGKQATQNDQIDTLIAKNIDVLICYVCESTGAIMVAEKCKAAGIPVAFLNTKVAGEALESYDRSWFVGSNNEDKAIVQTQIIDDLLDKSFADVDKNGDGKINMFYIQGPNNEDMAICLNAVEDWLENGKYKGVVEMVGHENNTSFSSSEAMEITETWIGRYGSEIELLLSHTDAMLMGAMEALVSADLLSESGGVYCIASNSLPEAQEYIKAGVQYSSVLTNPYEQAETIMKIAMASACDVDTNYGDVLHLTDYEFRNGKIVYITLQPIYKENVDVAAQAYGMASEK